MTNTVIAHITDPHTTSLAQLPRSALIGKRALGYLSWRRKRRHHHTQAMLEATTNAALNHSPDALVVTGDLLHVGHVSEMREIRNWLHALSERVPVLLVPGNHDLYHRDSLPHWTQTLTDLPIFGTAVSGQQLWPRQLTVNRVRVIGLSSAYPAPLLKADGQLGADQLSALTTALHTPADYTHTLLALHHPADPGVSAKRKALKDAEGLQKVLAAAPPAGLLHGHLHTNMSYEVAGVPCYCTASASSIGASAPAAFRLLTFSESAPLSVRLFQATSNGDGDSAHDFAPDYRFEEQKEPQLR